jgi:hypothetical protein
MYIHFRLQVPDRLTVHTVRFDAFTVMLVKIQVLWVVTQRRLVNVYLPTHHNIPEDFTLQLFMNHGKRDFHYKIIQHTVSQTLRRPSQLQLYSIHNILYAFR